MSISAKVMEQKKVNRVSFQDVELEIFGNGNNGVRKISEEVGEEEEEEEEEERSVRGENDALQDSEENLLEDESKR